MGQSFWAQDRRQSSYTAAETSLNVASDEVYLKIDGRMAYLWRAVDSEGEIVDVLVQTKRNKAAALTIDAKASEEIWFRT